MDRPDGNVKRLGRLKAECLRLYQHEPDSGELRQAIEKLHNEAARLNISIEAIDTEVLSRLEGSSFFVHNTIRPPPPIEDLKLREILIAWRAVLGEGRLQIDKHPQVGLGTISSWAEWSGSRWVTARKERIQKNAVKCFEAHLHCSFPPGFEPKTARDHEIVREYGQWISETEWSPPPNWTDDFKELFVQDNSLTFEEMTIDQLLKCWRAIHAEGGLKIDTTRYVPGVFIFWSQWSGSHWVARLHKRMEEGKVLGSAACLLLAFAPGGEPTELDQEMIRKYGRWVSETEWEPAQAAETEIIGTTQLATPQRRPWWRLWRHRLGTNEHCKSPGRY
jgi:hypothetical protein